LTPHRYFPDTPGSDPDLVRLRERGCLRKDRTKYCMLKFTDQKGVVQVGAKKEKKLFKEMYKEQTSRDAVVKEIGRAHV
jgi:hypothetical protein